MPSYNSTIISGPHASCCAYRLDWTGKWHCQVGIHHYGLDGRYIGCDAVFTFTAVCDDFGNLVRVREAE